MTSAVASTGLPCTGDDFPPRELCLTLPLGGPRPQKIYLTSPIPFYRCYEGPTHERAPFVNGGFGEWQPCRAYRGQQRLRMRHCDSPRPSGGGKACPGIASEPCRGEDTRDRVDEEDWVTKEPKSVTVNVG